MNPDVYHPQWQHCAILPDDIMDGDLDNGPLPDISCVLNKTEKESSVRATFNTNLNLFSCEECCMRWFVTLNGEECTDPAPIEAVVAASDVTTLSIHRGSTVTGECEYIHTWEADWVCSRSPGSPTSTRHYISNDSLWE